MAAMTTDVEQSRVIDELRGALDTAQRNAARMAREARVLRSIVEGTEGEIGEGFL
jgi:hypothetical protein